MSLAAEREPGRADDRGATSCAAPRRSRHRIGGVPVGPEQALANMLAGLTPSGDAPRQLRNLQEPVACVHAQMTSTGTVTVGWGIGTFEDRIGGRAEARVLLAHGQTDLTRRHGPGRLAG